MPKSLTELAVFISSPSDMSAERTLIQQAVDVLSKELESSHRLKLRALKWEEDVVPGIGETAQSVISSQIGDDYDIYIGVLGTYFGTPSGSYASGTESEFRAAYARYVAHPDSVRVLFYFKTAVENIYAMDIDQFQKVMNFRNELQETVLYGTFLNPDDLLKKLRGHLARLISDQWEGQKWKVQSPIHEPGPSSALSQGVSANLSSSEEQSEAEEDGLMELVAIAMEESGRINQIMVSMTEDSGILQGAFEVFTPNLQAAQSTSNPQAAVRVYDELADQMLSYEKRLASASPQLGSALEGALQAYLKLKRLVRAELPVAEEALAQTTDGLTKLHAVIKQTRETITGVRDITLAVPPFTKRLRSAKRRLAAAFDSYIASVTIFLSQFEASLDR
jgi:hypothetical protein